MSNIEHLTYPLPTSLIGILLAMVETAEKDGALSVIYNEEPSRENFGSFDISVNEHTIKNVRGSPILSLQYAGFIESLNNGNCFLRPIAFDRARYEKRWRVAKWWERTWKSGRPLSIVSIILSLIAFVVSLVVSSSSAVIELLQLYGYLPKP